MLAQIEMIQQTIKWSSVTPRLVGLFIFFNAMQASIAEDWKDCSDRFAHRAAPEFPTSLKATHALMAGPCTISATFNLLQSGEVENLAARAEEDRCVGFEKPVMRSIQLSKFKAGTKIVGCRILISLEYEDGSQ